MLKNLMLSLGVVLLLNCLHTPLYAQSNDSNQPIRLLDPMKAPSPFGDITNKNTPVKPIDHESSDDHHVSHRVPSGEYKYSTYVSDIKTRITLSYPNTWLAEKSNSQGVLQTFTKDYGRAGEGCVLSIWRKPSLPNDVDASSVRSYLSHIEKFLPQKARLIAHDIVNINGIDALNIKTVNTVNIVSRIYSDAYHLIRDDKIVSFDCNTVGSLSDDLNGSNNFINSSNGVFSQIAHSIILHSDKPVAADNSALSNNSIANDSLENMDSVDFMLNAIQQKEYGAALLMLALTIAITWTTGLLPPLLIRFLIFRRRLTAWPARIVVGAFLVFNVTIFTYINHASGIEKPANTIVWWLVAYISYKIIGPKKNKAGKRIDSDDTQEAKIIEPLAANYNHQEKRINVDGTSGSFLRGAGQLFLLDTRDTAQRPDAPESIVQDWNIIKNWLQCDDDNITPEMMHKFTIAWQSYLALGEAPSLKLITSFRFYQQEALKENWEIASVADDVLGVFNRMLATDQEIDEKNTKQAILERGKEREAQSCEPAINWKDIKECIHDAIHYSTRNIVITVPHQALWIISICLLIAIIPMPYDFYTLLRIVVCGCAGYMCYQLYDAKYQGAWVWILGGIAVLFNPLVPIHLEKGTWAFLDLLAGGIFAVLAYKRYQDNKS